MTGQLDSFFAALAASDVTPKGLHEGAHWIGSNGPGALVEVVIRVRRRMSAWLAEMGIREGRMEFLEVPTQKVDSRARESIVGRVERLLRGEANLSARAAIAALLGPLERMLPADKINPRLGFRRCIERMLRYVPPSVLLREATKIRNSVAHAPVRDWPLRSRKKARSALVIEIEQLLTHQTGLTRSKAMDLLSAEIDAMMGGGLKVTPHSKEGFATWVARLREHVPDNIIMRAAKNVRRRHGIA